MQTIPMATFVADQFQAAYNHEVNAAAVYNHFAAVQSAKGYAKLAAKHVAESAEEQGHARQIAEWLTICGQETESKASFIVPGNTKVTEQLNIALGIEEKAINLYQSIMDAAEGESDWNSFAVAEKILADTREHYVWLAQQLSLIEEIGLPDWLAMWS